MRGALRWTVVAAGALVLLGCVLPLRVWIGAGPSPSVLDSAIAGHAGDAWPARLLIALSVLVLVPPLLGRVSVLALAALTLFGLACAATLETDLHPYFEYGALLLGQAIDHVFSTLREDRYDVLASGGGGYLVAGLVLALICTLWAMLSGRRTAAAAG